MMERLKTILDAAEEKPKLKKIVLKIASFPESLQEEVINFIELFLEAGDEYDFKLHENNQ